MTRRDWIAVAVIVAAFAIAAFIVDPRGNFPLDDDWDFALGAWSLAQTGTVQHTPFTVAIAVLQYCWGALWTIAFGQSFTVLRISTLVLSAASVLILYATLRRLAVTTGVALFAALAFLFHPLYFWASFTFMTHVPELFLGIAALALLVEAERRQSDAWLVTAALVAMASCFIRQTGVVNVAAPFLAALISRKEAGDRWRRIAIVYGTALAVVALLAASGLLLVPNAQTSAHLSISNWWDAFVAGPAHYGMFNVQYAAVFFLPLLMLAPAIRVSRAALAVFGAWFGAIAIHMLALRRPIPYPARGNVFVNFTLGPSTLRDTFVFGRPYPFHAGSGWLIALMIVSTALAVLLAGLITRATVLGSSEGAEARFPFIARVAAIYCICGTLLHMFMRIYFDRYSIDTMWPVAILIPLAVPRVPRIAAALALALTIVFAVSGTAEYLSWNRARWTAFRWLKSRGVRLEQMDGGYEINALLAVQRGRKDLGKPGFGVADDRYILTFGNVPGYREIARFPYRRLLGEDGVVRVMQRGPFTTETQRTPRPL